MNDKNIAKKLNKMKLHLSASFRVNIDTSTSIWKLRRINRYELIDIEKKTKILETIKNLKSVLRDLGSRFFQELYGSEKSYTE